MSTSPTQPGGHLSQEDICSPHVQAQQALSAKQEDSDGPPRPPAACPHPPGPPGPPRPPAARPRPSRPQAAAPHPPGPHCMEHLSFCCLAYFLLRCSRPRSRCSSSSRALSRGQERHRRPPSRACWRRVSPSLPGVHVVEQLVPLVDQGHQLLEQQVLPLPVGLGLLPVCRDTREAQRGWTGPDGTFHRDRASGRTSCCLMMQHQPTRK